METCKSIPDTSPLSAQDWEREAKRDPGLPRTFRDLARMANGLFTDVHPAVAAQGSPGVADFVAGLSDEHIDERHHLPIEAYTCSTPEMTRYYIALRNPDLDEELRSLLPQPPPSFQHSMESAEKHFKLYWDSTGNLAIPQPIVQDAAEDLEASYSRYETTFGKAPSVNQIEVKFWDPLTPNTQMPAGPINLPVDSMKADQGNRLMRNVTVSHELFHVLQGRFGFRAQTPQLWFLEGSATWAEAVFLQAISGASKLDWFFSYPTKTILSMRYESLPFLIYLENLMFSVKTGPYVMVDIFNSVSGPDPDPFELIDALAKQRLAGYDLDRVLVQFGVQAPLGTWYKTASGTPAIPLFRDAEQSAHPELPYPQRIELDPQFAYTFTQPQCARPPAAEVSRSGLFFFKATSRAGRSDFKIVGTAQAGQRKNPYLGAAVFTASTGDSAPGHSPIPLDASLTDVSIACNGDKEGAYYVVAGSPVQGRTTFTVTVDGGAIP
jgi:hypothetical protein